MSDRISVVVSTIKGSYRFVVDGGVSKMVQNYRVVRIGSSIRELFNLMLPMFNENIISPNKARKYAGFHWSRSSHLSRVRNGTEIALLQIDIINTVDLSDLNLSDAKFICVAPMTYDSTLLHSLFDGDIILSEMVVDDMRIIGIVY